MKDELLKIAQECMTEEEVKQIVKEKFVKAFSSAVEASFRWGELEKTIKKKIIESMVPYIEKYDFSEHLPKLDVVLTEIVNSDLFVGQKTVINNFKDLMFEPDEKEVKITDLFKKWIKKCEREIDTDGLEICYDDGVSYCDVDCEMYVEILDRPSWSSIERVLVTFKNDHDESLNKEISLTAWVKSSGEMDSYKLSVSSDVCISSLAYLDEFEVYLLKLERAGTSIVIDKGYEESSIIPEAEPEATFS